MHLSYIRLILVISFLLLVSGAFAKTDKYRCMWRDDPATTMVIGWNQISGNKPILYYDVVDHGLDTPSYSWSQSVDRSVYAKGMNNNFVRLQNLQANTTYYFIIADSDGSSKRMFFQTAPDDSYERLSIIAGGDSRNHRKGRCNANKLVSKLRPHCVLFGGDMTGSDKSREWKYWFDDWQYTIAQDGRLTPLIPARGNHEYSNRTLVDLFDVRNEKVYYALNLGGNLLRVYTLNSLIASGGNQKKWLEEDLTSHQDMTWKVAQYHFAIRPHTKKKRERKDQYNNWAKLFYKHQVNMVVESDAHVVKTTWPVIPSVERGNEEGFIRDNLRGTVYIGEGCWGAPLRRNNDDKQWTRNSGSFNQFKWIFVDHEKIEIRTVQTDNADQVGVVDPYYVFEPPTGISIWEPSNGAVITIPRRQFASDDYLVSTTPIYSSSSNNESNGSSKANINLNASKFQSAKVPANIDITDIFATINTDDIAINWKTKNETSAALQFEVQRSTDGRDYHTIAQVVGIGPNGSSDNSYKISDRFEQIKNANQLAYRVKAINTSGLIKYYKVNNVPKMIWEWHQYQKILPDPNSGILKIRYELAKASDVNIKMVGVNKAEISQSEYLNQKSGNYQRTIDMKSIPEGMYLLTIEINNEVEYRYHVIKKA